MNITVTGSSGLIGQALGPALAARGHRVRGLDLRAHAPEAAGDVLDPERVRAALAEADGVVHLAAVSRVLWGEADPARCMLVNVTGVERVLRAALASRRAPWVLFVSSREVYGEAPSLPVTEDLRPAPMNVYGRSKLLGEQLAMGARAEGLGTAVVRLSNVYGSVDDHHDRVVPAFARAAAEGRDLRVDGSGHTFDFTHLRDAVSGLAAVVDALGGGARELPPVHFLTGRGTTLRQLADIAIAAAGTASRVVEAPSRTYDVARFYGDPGRAAALFGWRPTVSVEEGAADLTRSFMARAAGAG